LIPCPEHTLSECGARKVHTIGELRAEKTQMDMQLVVARLAATGVVANEASSRAALEATVKSVEDRATAAEATTASAVMERESLETRLAQAEAKIKELRASTMTANKAAERATVTVTAAEAAAQTAACAATQEKTTLKSKVAGLERDLATAGADLRMANKQFSRWPIAPGHHRRDDPALGRQLQIDVRHRR
jgi:chromosome segregation ATPase